MKQSCYTPPRPKNNGRFEEAEYMEMDTTASKYSTPVRKSGASRYSNSANKPIKFTPITSKLNKGSSVLKSSQKKTGSAARKSSNTMQSKALIKTTQSARKSKKVASTLVSTVDTMHSTPARPGAVNEFSIMQNGGDAFQLRPPPAHDTLNEDLPPVSRFDVENLAREVRSVKTNNFFPEVTKQDLFGSDHYQNVSQKVENDVGNT
jgi:hypothetical protein